MAAIHSTRKIDRRRWDGPLLTGKVGTRIGRIPPTAAAGPLRTFELDPFLIPTRR